MLVRNIKKIQVPERIIWREKQMKFKLYTDVHEFYKDTYDILLRHEEQNLVMLGNLMMGKKGEDKTAWRDPAHWLMATVSDANSIVLTALMTPPYNITLYATDNVIIPEAVTCMIDGLSNYKIPGVVSEKSLAEFFANEYTSRNLLKININMSQRIYTLSSVNSAVKQFGSLRLLKEEDMNFFPYWFEAFQAASVYGNTKMTIPEKIEEYRYRLSTKKLHVLEVDGIPVAMAGFSKELKTALGVAFVYTPPYNRGKGYATSCVAKLSQLALDQGFSKCVLYTDLLNPTSNSIYQQIGYEPICDSMELKFIVQ